MISKFVFIASPDEARNKLLPTRFRVGDRSLLRYAGVKNRFSYDLQQYRCMHTHTALPSSGPKKKRKKMQERPLQDSSSPRRHEREHLPSLAAGPPARGHPGSRQRRLHAPPPRRGFEQVRRRQVPRLQGQRPGEYCRTCAPLAGFRWRQIPQVHLCSAPAVCCAAVPSFHALRTAVPEPFSLLRCSTVQSVQSGVCAGRFCLLLCWCWCCIVAPESNGVGEPSHRNVFSPCASPRKSCVLKVHAPARIKTTSVDAYMQETRATKRICMRIIQVNATVPIRCGMFCPPETGRWME